MACGCNKKSTNKKDLISRGKKVAEKKAMPLITIRKRTSSEKKKSSK